MGKLGTTYLYELRASLDGVLMHWSSIALVRGNLPSSIKEFHLNEVHKMYWFTELLEFKVLLLSFLSLAPGSSNKQGFGVPQHLYKTSGDNLFVLQTEYTIYENQCLWNIWLLWTSPRGSSKELLNLYWYTLHWMAHWCQIMCPGRKKGINSVWCSKLNWGQVRCMYSIFWLF